MMAGLVVGDLPRVNAERRLESPAYIDGDRVSTWAEVDDRVNRLAAALRDDLGLSVGDVLGVLSANRVECLEAMFAASRGGVVHTALKTRAHVSEMLRQLQDAGAKALIVGPGFEEQAKYLKAKLEPLTLVGLSGCDAGPSLEDILAAKRNAPVESHNDADAIYSVMYTSGSTGDPKGVAIASRNEFAYSRGLAWAMQLEQDDIVANVLPLEHRGGQALAMTLALYGLPMVLEMPDPSRILATVHKRRVSVLFIVPTVASMMCDTLESDPDRYDVSSVRQILAGSNPVSASIARRLLANFPAKLCQAGGNSEGAPAMVLTAVDYDRILSDSSTEHRIWSCGRPAMGTRVAVWDENDQPVPDGELGELVYQGDQFVDGYWRKPEASAHAWRGGWFHSGDVGYRDVDGYLYYTDRLFGRIKTGSETVYAREVEAVLERHPDVVEVAVVGVLDEKWGEAVTAGIVTRRELPDAEARAAFCIELTALAHGELARFKAPKHYVFVDALPRTALGKIAYGETRDQLAMQLSTG